MYKIDHIGIAVKDMQKSNDLYSKLLNAEPYKQEVVAAQKVLTSFFQTGESKVELVAGIEEGNPIDKYIERKGEGIHHVAFQVNDIRAEMARLKSEGFRLLSEEPSKGADNMWVCFVHPKSANGVLVELVQPMLRG